MLALGVFLAVPSIRVVWEDRSMVFAYTNLQRETCMMIGLLPYHVTDAVLSWRKDRITDADQYRVREFLDNKRDKLDSRPELFGHAGGRNLILISAESLQAFPIELEFRGQPVMPRLFAFAKESLYFMNFYDQTYLGTTADGEFMALQSLHPLPVGVVATRYPTNHFHGLPAILAEHGYTTISAVAAPGGFWRQNQTHPRLGFQRSYFEESYKVQERIGSWMEDKEFFSQTLHFLKAQAEPFMAFLLSSSNHGPWELPKRYHVLELGELEGTLLGNYLQSVHYFDTAFGEFIDELQAVGLLDRSVIGLYGDHQAFLGELPELARVLKFDDRIEYHHLLVRKKVPFMVRLPHAEAAGARGITGGHLDIAPTLLSLLGIVDENKVMLGEDLTRRKNSPVVFRDGSFVDGTHIFVNRFGPISNSTCYRIGAAERADCAPFEPQRVKAREQLEISDLIVRNDLIPSLTTAKDALR
jgi:phosphoglycerol transferase MdoB-like AlkP superfamily enzyme